MARRMGGEYRTDPKTSETKLVRQTKPAGPEAPVGQAVDPEEEAATPPTGSETPVKKPVKAEKKAVKED